MRQNSGKKKRKILWIVIPVALFVLILGVSLFYLETYYHADEQAIAAFAVDGNAAETALSNGDLVFDPGDAKVGLIFYPGGKVEHAAYVPLMRSVASGGVLCAVCRMPFRLAVFDMHAADAVRAAYPDVEHWYIGGHSLGGVMAAEELARHEDVYDGLILLGSYSTKDLSNAPIRVLSMYGSEDRVLDRAKYEENRKNLPQTATETVIEGGCHAYFGMYGAQDGDGLPTISCAEQIRRTAREILQWMEKVK